jgi:hypothetical protein
MDNRFFLLGGEYHGFGQEVFGLVVEKAGVVGGGT